MEIVLDISPKEVFTQRYHGKLDIISIGEWRKGIAIGYRKDPTSYHSVPCLINNNDKIIYEGYSCYDYVEGIYRTSKGYYVVTESRDFSAPGKDSKFMGTFLKCVISEDGTKKIFYSDFKNGHYKNDWFDSEDLEVFTPKEMGQSIVEYNNVFYRLDDFTKLFEIPKKFKIESIFEQGFCLLSVPEDNRDIIVTVKDKEIVEYFDVNNYDSLFKLIDKTGIYSLIELCKNDNLPTINILKKQREIIERQNKQEKSNRLRKIYCYSSYTFPRNYISKDLTTLDEFKNGIDLNKNEIIILKELHTVLSKEEGLETTEKKSFHIRENKFSPENSLDCLIYRDFYILKMEFGGYGERIYRFYSIDGKCLSSKMYSKLYIANNSKTEIEYDENFNNNSFYYENEGKDRGILIVKENKLSEMQFPEKLGWISVHDKYLSTSDDYYDFFFNKIDVQYVDVQIDEIINKYLYNMIPSFPDFEVGRDYFFNNPEGIYIDGRIVFPNPRSLELIGSELYLRCHNRPNHIDEVSHIGDYVDEYNEEYSLYLFKCRPHAYCDTKGRVFYDFNPDEIVL